MMADMGAEVVKVEFGPHGDHLRGYTPLKAGLRAPSSCSKIAARRASASMSKRTRASASSRELAAKADVLIENYSPGVLKRRGLGYEDLRKLNPRLIMCSISAFGQDGPFSHRNGNDTMAVAMSGLTHLTGDPDGSPTYIGASIADANAGIHAFSAVCAALFNRAHDRRRAATSIFRWWRACSICTTLRWPAISSATAPTIRCAPARIWAAPRPAASSRPATAT